MNNKASAVEDKEFCDVQVLRGKLPIYIYSIQYVKKGASK